MEKIFVIGNCQSAPLAQYLSYHIPNITVLPIDIANGSGQISEENKKFILDVNSIVLTQPLRAKSFSWLATEELKKVKKNNVYTITNFHFSGLYPDIIYVGSMGKRLHSATGDYNSNIVLKSFLEGLNTKDCIKKFNYQTYCELGYFEKWEFAETELIERDKNVDIKFAKKFLDIIEEKGCMFSINHPTDYIFNEYAIEIAKFLGFSPRQYPSDMFTNSLGASPWNAIYSEIAEYHHIKWKYINKYRSLGKLLNIEEFVDISYAKYSEQEEKIRHLFLSKEEQTFFERDIDAVIHSLYWFFLFRAPDTVGLNGYRETLHQEFSVENIMRIFESFAVSAEFQEKIDIFLSKRLLNISKKE